MATIGIMDSGVGGLSVLREILKALPNENYIYFSDNAFCPYGDKSPDFIRDRCKDICEHFLSEGAEAMVLACYTATAAAISMLRDEYNIPFVGMEPAIKPAAHKTHSGVVGVLATAGTLKGDKYHITRDLYSGNISVKESVGRGFVELVEKGELAGAHAKSVVQASLQPLLDAGADTVVLGCTHYPFLLDTMRAVAGPGVTFIDPAPAVAAHLKDILVDKGLATLPNAQNSSAPSTPTSKVKLESSGDDAALRRMFAMINSSPYVK